MEFKVSYIKEALKEPINVGGLLVAGAAAANMAAANIEKRIISTKLLDRTVRPGCLAGREARGGHSRGR